MVYNAMKLFMEINPQLFDDCSHDYTEQQNSAPAREALRESKWATLAVKAEQQRAALGLPAEGAESTVTTTTAAGLVQGNLSRVDEVDPMSEDNQKRLDSLKLQDGRRVANHERQGSAGSARSK